MWTRQTLGLSLALLVIVGHAMAKEKPAEPQHHQPENTQAKATNEKPATDAGRTARRLPREQDRLAANRTTRRPTTRQRLSERGPDRYIGPAHGSNALKVVGQRQVGSAAWYSLVGQRTASGDTLDVVRATAAHRSLPLLSLARVTNLKNGRSVIVKVTDRGPVSHNLLIDLSPRAADMLDMKRAGVVPVSIEPVIEVAQLSNVPAPQGSLFLQ